ncbi:MAG: hypothetical protein WBQ45_21225 [Roseiarcus sp.]
MTRHFDQRALERAAVSGVPESSTWAMMLLGFASLGYAGYRASPREGAFGRACSLSLECGMLTAVCGVPHQTSKGSIPMSLALLASGVRSREGEPMTSERID